MFKLITLAVAAALLSACSGMPMYGHSDGATQMNGRTAQMGNSAGTRSGTMKNGDGPN
jgi:hypothetical protein